MYQQDQPQPLLGSILLLVTAVIWGCAFVAQSVAMDFVKPFTFCGARFLLSGTALVPVILLRKRMGIDDGCSRRSGRGRARFRTFRWIISHGRRTPCCFPAWSSIPYR